MDGQRKKSKRSEEAARQLAEAEAAAKAAKDEEDFLVANEQEKAKQIQAMMDIQDRQHAREHAMRVAGEAGVLVNTPDMLVHADRPSKVMTGGRSKASDFMKNDA